MNFIRVYFLNRQFLSTLSLMSRIKLTGCIQLASGKFRTGGISAEEYIEGGSSIMGRAEFMKLLPDLLRTLPEGKHKRALHQAALQVTN